MNPIHSLREDRKMKNYSLGVAKDRRRRQRCKWCTNVRQWRLFTESKTHRIVGVGRDLCGPIPLPKQGHLEQATQDLVQAGFEYLQRRRIRNLPGQPVPGLRHPQGEEVLPCVQLKLPVLQFVPIAPCPVTGHHWQEFGPILLTPTLQMLGDGRKSALRMGVPSPWSCVLLRQHGLEGSVYDEHSLVLLPLSPWPVWP